MCRDGWQKVLHYTTSLLTLHLLLAFRLASRTCAQRKFFIFPINLYSSENMIAWPRRDFINKLTAAMCNVFRDKLLGQVGVF